MSHRIGLIVALGVVYTPQAHSQITPYRTFSLGCDELRNVATTYLQRRGVRISDWPFKQKDWRACRETGCYQLDMKQLRGLNGEQLDWSQIRERYTQVGTRKREHDDERTWSLGSGWWESTTEWRAGGELWFRQQGNGCSMKLDVSYGRGVRQHFLFFPWDPSNDLLGSNGRFEEEALTAIERELAQRP
jgi:hypothetical protein